VTVSPSDPAGTPPDPAAPPPAPVPTSGAATVRLASAQGRWVLLATVLASAMAFLDSSAVNVALPTIGREQGSSLAGLQWVVTGYTLTLAALILLGGALGDRYGRRRVFVVGVAWFAAASLVCGLAQSTGQLVGARVLQGVGGALLTPGSLALIQASFVPRDRPRAIGLWSSLGGVAGLVGPFLGGFLVDTVGWRWVFGINVPIAVVALLAARHLPESRDPATPGSFDVLGAVLGVVALAGTTDALIAAGDDPGSPQVWTAGAVGVVAAVGFLWWERRVPAPVLPPSLFRDRQFTGANLSTLAVYGALGGWSFFVVLELQDVLGLDALAAGAAMLPPTVLLILLSARAGTLAQRIGPRRPMTVGPLVAAAGMLLLVRVDAGSSYWADVLPGSVLVGLGMSLLVAPLTATVLGAAPDALAGVASGVNNAVARAAGLLAVAALPVAVGLPGGQFPSAAVFTAGFETAMAITAALMAAGGVLAWLTVRDDVLRG
jgi:EmrB/QacA subfamily drug resistance transporter